MKIKYDDIVRMDCDLIKVLRGEYDRAIAIKEIILFYTPQFNALMADYSSMYGDKANITLKTDELSIKFDSVYNNAPHNLAVKIKSNLFEFNLEEMFNNCGILVSCRTSTYYHNRGIATLLQAVKEDIAYLRGYSFMMYTDRVSTVVPSFNTRIMTAIGAKEVFRGKNTRSYNDVAVWIKDLTEYYKTRVIKKVETEELTVLTVAEPSKQVEEQVIF